MKTILWRTARFFGRPLKALFTEPAVRYPYWFSLYSSIAPSPKEQIVEMAMHFVSKGKVPGDYLEFGVFRGASFIRAMKIHDYLFRRKRQLEQMQFYAFDSFQGLPDISSPVDREVPQFEGGQYAAGRDLFLGNLKKAGVDVAKVHLVPGFYQDSLNARTKATLPLRAAAIVHIDCDLYESTLQVLDFLTDYIQDGTVILFDDWMCFKGHPNRGERRAFSEWLRKNPQFMATEWYRVSWQATSFLIHRADGPDELLQ